MIVVAPPGETWDADGNEEALVRNPHGVATYSMRDIKVVKPKRRPEPEPQPKVESQPEPEPEPQPKPEPQPEPRPKKKHKRFTSPAPDIGNDGVKAYQEKLEGLLDDAPPEARASMGSSQSEQNPETGDDYIPTARELARVIAVPKRPSPLSQVQNAESDVSTTASSSPPHSPRLEPSTASNIKQRTPEGRRRYMEWISNQPPCLPRAGDRGLEIVYRAPPQKRQETPKQMIQAPDQTPQACRERIWRWKDFVRRYHVIRNRPTSRELAQVIVVPKDPSPLSQVHNADSDDSTTPTSSPPHSPRLRSTPNTVVNNSFRSFDETLRLMDDLDDKPARDRCLPRPRDPELKLVYRAPPEKEVKIIGWQLSNGMRDVCYLIQLVGSPSAPL